VTGTLAEVTILIESAVRRFGVYKSSLFYIDSHRDDNLIDGIENLVNTPLGFEVTCNSVLIRSDKNIIVDPGHFKLASYGILAARLKELDLEISDIHAIVNTHCHDDHTGSNYLFRGKKLYIHEKELDFARTIYWKEYVSAFFEILDIQETTNTEIAKDVRIIETPGHTPGSISVVVGTHEGLVATIGDTAMTEGEMKQRELSRWYTPEAKAQINKSIDLIQSLHPVAVILGHGRHIIK
jgi:glyoxylase-like metal-dependent hydrolase (beta-lactamase superfamily II)